MSFKTRTYLAMALSVVMLFTMGVAPLCAHGASCEYTDSRTAFASVGQTAPQAVSSMPAQPHEACGSFAAEDHAVGHRQEADGHATGHSRVAGDPIEAAGVSGDIGMCCDHDAGGRMRLADDRANFTQPLPDAALAVVSLAATPVAVVAEAVSFADAPPPPQKALSSTVIRI